MRSFEIQYLSSKQNQGTSMGQQKDTYSNSEWLIKSTHRSCQKYMETASYEACPESKDTKVLNMYNIFNFDTVNELPVHNFIFQHSRRHCPHIY